VKNQQVYYYIAAAVVLTLLVLFFAFRTPSDNSGTKAKTPDCKREITDSYSECAGKVDTRYQSCMNHAKVLFNESDRSNGISECRRKAVKEIAICKENHTICDDKKAD
jgi:RNase P/RNase MRP subunit POP5